MNRKAGGKMAKSKIDWAKVWEEFCNWYDNNKEIEAKLCKEKPCFDYATTYCYRRIIGKIQQLVEKQLKQKRSIKPEPKKEMQNADPHP